MTFDAIVIGAGVVGPCMSTALARQGKKVLIVERDWSEPDRIVGELMQPAGVKALRELGMVKAVNGVGARNVTGYYIKYYQQELTIDYPSKEEVYKTNPVKAVPLCVKDGNDKMSDNDPDLSVEDWDKDENVRGVSFQHGKFITNLRNIVRAEENVTWVEGTVTKLVRDERNLDVVRGVVVKTSSGEMTTYTASVTFACDGIYSKFRKEHASDNVPAVESYFVALALEDCKLPMVNKGHVIMGDHAPVLIYRVSEHETRMLCAFRSSKPPSSSTFFEYLENDVMHNLPKSVVPSFKKCLKERKFRAMPNQYLSAPKQGIRNKGFIMLGDSLNLRHPLTGGGMTVGINDTALLAKLLYKVDLADHDEVARKLSLFHTKRKNLDAVINTLSIALYSLFAADKKGLKILQEGCFEYFLLGGDCLKGPMGLLSGMLPFPMLLFNHFFSVAFYAIYCNYAKRGVSGFPLAFIESFQAFFTAVIVFTPYLWSELVN